MEDVELSGWWPRVAASLIDAVVISLAAALVLLAIGFDFEEWWASDTSLLVATGENEIVFLLVNAAVAGLYFVPFMLRWNGRTPGKAALGIRVIRADRRPLDAWTVILRQVVLQYLVGAFVALLAIVDYLLPLPDGQNRAGHDFLARTRVVRA